jgi:hypothetical protein
MARVEGIMKITQDEYWWKKRGLVGLHESSYDKKWPNENKFKLDINKK